jgi:perosamine synthetase
MLPPEIEDLRKYCDTQVWFFIEDAAHAPGARLRGKAAGSFGHAGCFSLFPTKVIRVGEGGMLTTDDEQLAKVARSLQYRGRDFSATHEHYFLPGRNVRLPELSALLGRIQLTHLDEFLIERRRVMAIYKEAFLDDQRTKLIIPAEETSSAYWKVPILLPRGVDRPALTSYLREAGVFIDHAYNPPLHLQPVFRALYNISEGHLPITEDLLSRHIFLPCHPRISDDEAHYVVHTLKAALDRFIC